MWRWIAVGLALASAGCRKEERLRVGEVAGAPVGTPPPPDAAPAPPVDAAPPPDADLAAVEWPASVAAEMITSTDSPSDRLGVSVSVPRFRTRPGEIAGELNERLARYAKLDPAFTTFVGMHKAECWPAVVNRFAVIVECKKMTDARTVEDHEARIGGAPAGPEPMILAVWLQPGLPPIELGQLAPGVDVARVLADAKRRAPADCQPEWCEYGPDSFSIDREGIAFHPIAYCGFWCDDEHLPRIPLDALRPTHPWAMKLVDRIRKRAAAHDDLAEGVTR